MPGKPTDEELDDELDGSFPASDPPSLTEPAGDARRRKAEQEEERAKKEPGRPAPGD
jgi:hypothetical protein